MIESLKSKFNAINLPGEEAHLEMTPYRNAVAKKLNHQKTPRHSAVSVLLFENNSDIECILIQRPTYEGTHSAQVAFPGGKQEEDETLIDTALRETKEEIGLHQSEIEIIGNMTDLYIPPSNFMVTPFLGTLAKTPNYTLDPREVEEVFSFPINQLIQTDNIPTTKITLSNGLKLDTPYFDINNKVVWGATAAMLNELRHILKSL